MSFDDELALAERAFETGDHHKVRNVCDELMSRGDPTVAEAASRLRRRTEIDPVQIAVLVVSFATLIAVTLMYVIGS